MRASVLFEQGKPLQVEALELEPPRAGEVAVRMTASGVRVNLDKAEAFTRPYARNPKDFDNWTYFWEGAPQK